MTEFVLEVPDQIFIGLLAAPFDGGGKNQVSRRLRESRGEREGVTDSADTFCETSWAAGLLLSGSYALRVNLASFSPFLDLKKPFLGRKSSGTAAWFRPG